MIDDGRHGRLVGTRVLKPQRIGNLRPEAVPAPAEVDGPPAVFERHVVEVAEHRVGARRLGHGAVKGRMPRVVGTGMAGPASIGGGETPVADGTRQRAGGQTLAPGQEAATGEQSGDQAEDYDWQCVPIRSARDYRLRTTDLPHRGHGHDTPQNR